MQFADLTEAYGSPFHQRVEVTHQRKDIKKEPFAAPPGVRFPITDIVAERKIATALPSTESFQVRESFSGNTTGIEERMNKLLLLLEQKQTLKTDPSSTHDLLLYVATGVFFLFTLDSFVLLGKGM